MFKTTFYNDLLEHNVPRLEMKVSFGNKTHQNTLNYLFYQICMTMWHLKIRKQTIFWTFIFLVFLNTTFPKFEGITFPRHPCFQVSCNLAWIRWLGALFMPIRFSFAFELHCQGQLRIHVYYSSQTTFPLIFWQ